LVVRENEFEVLVQGVAGCDAVAVFRCDAKAGVFHAQRLEDAPLKEGIERLTGYPLDDHALKLLLQAVPEHDAGLCFQRQFRHLGDHVLVGAAEQRGRGVDLIQLRIGAAHRRAEGEAGGRSHQVTHGHRTIERHELAILHHLQIRELGNKLGDGVVELPLALFVQGHHRGGDDRLGHRGDAENGVFP
jgi:hypothetical protein